MFRRALMMFPVLAGLAAGAYAQSQNLTMQIAGVSRKYIAYAPSGLTGNPPLVYVIHGFNMTAQQMVTITKMNALADTAKCVVVYPDALNNSSNQPSWDLSGPNDYNFILAIIDTMEARYHIDRKRVYPSGFSQGGFMSFQLGCRYADRFAAIAPVSGTIALPGSSGGPACTPSRPVPMFLTFGTKDAAPSSQFMQSVDAWLKLNECPTTPKKTSPYPAGNANSVVTRLEYGPCKEDAAVVVDSIVGGPHEWPMNTATKVNNSVEVWNFLKKYSLKAGTGLPRPVRGAAAGKISVTYAQGWIRLQGAGERSSARILDNRGRLAATADAGQTRIDFRGRPAGIYQVLMSGGGGENSAAVKVAVP